MNTYKQAPHFKKQMHWFRLAGNFLALSNVLLFLIRCIGDFHVCSGQFVLHWYVGILRFLLSFPCSTVPGLVELAGPRVSTHSQMFTHVYLFITNLLAPSLRKHPPVPTTCQAWLHVLQKRKNNILAFLFPAPWDNSSHLLCLHFLWFTICFLFWFLIVSLCKLPAK